MEQAMEAFEKHQDMYERHYRHAEQRIQKLAPFRTGDDKKEREKLQEDKQTAMDKLDALRWFGRDAGLTKGGK